MTEVPDVGILQDLAIIVVHEAVAKGVEVGQDGQKEENTHPRGVVTQETRYPWHEIQLREALLDIQSLSFLHRRVKALDGSRGRKLAQLVASSGVR